MIYMHFEICVRSLECLHDASIFLGLEAAGAVDENATGFQELARVFEEVALLLYESLKFLGTNAPAQLNTAAHHAGIGTRGVDENAIELWCARLAENCTPWLDIDRGDAKPAAVFANQVKPGGRDIGGDEFGFVGR